MNSEDRGGNPEIMAIIGKAHLTWKRYVQKALVGQGITIKQYYLLLQLASNPYLYPAQVADMLYADRPTASVILGNMKKYGWIQKLRDPNNRKQIRISITPAGREKLAETRRLPALQARFEADPLGGFSEREKARFLELSQTLLAHIIQITQPNDGD